MAMHSLLSGKCVDTWEDFYRSFIKGIGVTGNEATIVYNMPLLDKKRQKKNQFCLSYPVVGGTVRKTEPKFLN